MNNIKLSYRNFVKHRPYSFLNLAGLSIGLSIVFIVLLYINEEIGYDTHHLNHKNTYRLIQKDSTRQSLSTATNPQIPKLFEEQLPEIESSVSYSVSNFTINNAPGKDEGHYYADNSITSIFSFNISSGDLKTLENDPYTVLVSESFAKAHFSTISVVGKTLEIGYRKEVATYSIAAVFKDFIKKSTFRPTLIVQNRSSVHYKEIMLPEQRGYQGYQSYIKLDKAASLAEVVNKINRIYKSQPNSFSHSYGLQPLSRVHLHSTEISGQQEKGSIKKIVIYAVIGSLILIMSLMNFLLFYTSITRKRFKEFAIRKINGLMGPGLLKMFVVESLLISLVASFLAFLFMSFSIPFFNTYTNSDLKFVWGDNYDFLMYSLCLVLVISLLSGLCFYRIAKRETSINLLHRNALKGSTSFFIGNGSVVVQLIIVCVMITFSVGFYKQLDFMMNSGKGFNSDNILMLKRRNWDATVFENDAIKHPNIEAISRGGVLPLSGGSQIYDINLVDTPSSSVAMELMRVDYNYIPLYQIKLLQGRNFSKDFPSDKTGRSLIINKSALKMLNLKNPIGTMTNEGEIIGVIDDIKFESFHKTLRPLFYRMPEITEYAEMNKMLRNDGDLLIRYREGEKESAINTVLKLLENQQMNVIADYSELTNPQDRTQAYVVFDPDYYTTLTDKVYGKEKTLQKVILFLTVISIFIAVFGLIGMSLYKVDQKTKEIGIRKVNGASITDVMLLLNRGFTKWALVAFVFAMPISYYSLGRWLEGFAYKTAIGWFVYALTAGLVLIIAILSVSFQSYKASIANPIKAIRTE